MTIEQVEQAYETIQSVLTKTPLTKSQTFSAMSGTHLYMKCENLQKTGSFKVRGAYNKISNLVREEGVTQVVAASAGNHAQGVAFAASSQKIASTIVMPLSTPIAKVSATRSYGADVVLAGSVYDEAYAAARKLQEKSDAVFVHPFDDEDVIAGQGSVAIEILHELPTVDAVILPAGGGGFLAGVAAYLKQINPRIRVIGVQAAAANALVQSFQAKKLVSTKSAMTIADGIAVKKPGILTTEYINRYVDDMVTVTDDEIAESILLLLERAKMVVEPAGAVALAATIHGKVNLPNKRVVSILSGGNIDVSMINKIVQRGLSKHGRQMIFSTSLPDSPGSLQRFVSVIADCGASIIFIQHDRLSSKLQLNEASVHVACEVAGTEHGKELLEALAKKGYRTEIE